MIDRSEADVRAHLAAVLARDFETFEEVEVRHALFRRRMLRIDVLAIPRDPVLTDLALAFETKGDRRWLIPEWAQALKQASDYVLATIEPKLAAHAGKRVMAAFVYPAPRWQSHGAPPSAGVTHEEMFLSGMGHMASYQRVGTARIVEGRRGPELVLKAGEELWTSTRGWRSNARNVLAGKRQIGSQRFPILEELRGLE